MERRKNLIGGIVMKKVNVNVYVSRDSAIRCGEAEYGQTSLEVNPADLTQEERDLLIKTPENDSFDLVSAPATLEGLRAAIRVRIEREAANALERAHGRLRERQRYLQYDMEKGVHNRGRYKNDIYILEYEAIPPPGALLPDIEVEAHYNLLKAAAAKMNERQQKSFEEQMQAREAKEKAAAAAFLDREAILGRYIEDFGTDNQKARAKLGVLPEDEVLEGFRNFHFGVLKDFPRYVKMKNFEHEEDCMGGDVTYEVSELDEATHDEMENITRIISSWPTSYFTFTLRRHLGTCDECAATREKHGILVTKQICDGFKISREYEI